MNTATSFYQQDQGLHAADILAALQFECAPGYPLTIQRYKGRDVELTTWNYSAEAIWGRTIQGDEYNIKLSNVREVEN